MEEKELISKLQVLKEIKPNQEWVVLAKREILGNPAPVMANPVRKATFSSILSVFSNRGLVYAAIALMVVFIGASGLLEYKLSNDVKVADKSAASLVALRNNIQALKMNAQTLSKAVEDKNDADATSAAQKVASVAKSLTQEVKNNPQLAREVAMELQSNKTLLDVNGQANVKAASDDLYKALVTEELGVYNPNRANLTVDQQQKLDEANALYAKGEYENALETVLLINTNNTANTNNSAAGTTNPGTTNPGTSAGTQAQQ